MSPEISFEVSRNLKALRSTLVVSSALQCKKIPVETNFFHRQNHRISVKMNKRTFSIEKSIMNDGQYL